MDQTYNIIPQNQAIQPYYGQRQVYYRPRMQQQQGAAMVCYPMQQGMQGLRDELTDAEVTKIINDYIATVPNDVLLLAGTELLSGKFDTAKKNIIKPLMEKICTAGVVAKAKTLPEYIFYGLVILAVVILGIKIYNNQKGK